MAEVRFVERVKCSDVSSLDRNVKNHFKWAGLVEKDCEDDFLSDYVWKIEDTEKV